MHNFHKLLINTDGDTGPRGRYAHLMVDDSSEYEITLYGGLNPTTTPIVYFGDTGKLRNNVWAKIRDKGPGLLRLQTWYTQVSERYSLVVLMATRYFTKHGIVGVTLWTQR
jgi:hypothetical protein